MRPLMSLPRRLLHAGAPSPSPSPPPAGTSVFQAAAGVATTTTMTGSGGAPPPPSVASAGRLFVRVVGYNEYTANGFPPDWRQTARNDIDTYPAVTGSPFSDPSANENSGYSKTRNFGAGYRPADGRIWTGVGNYYTWPGQPPWDGFYNFNGTSGSPVITCFHIDDPKTIRRCFGQPTVDRINEMYAGGAVNPWKGHYEGEDKFLIIPGTPFGNEWHPGQGAVTISPVTYVNATTAEFVCEPGVVVVNRKLRFRINHPTGGSYVRIRGRVTSVTNLGGSPHRIRVTLSWWDTHATFQNPIEVVLATDTFSTPGSGHFHPLGAWQVGDNLDWHYKESNGKWYIFWVEMNYSTYLQSERLFEVSSAEGSAYASTGAQDPVKSFGSGTMMTPEQTGRGWEFWGMTSVGGSHIARWDLTNNKVDWWTNPLSGWGNAPVAYNNVPCADDAGTLYALQPCNDSAAPVMTTNRMLVFDIHGASPTGVFKNMTHLVVPQNFSNNLGFCNQLVWNPDLQMIECYVARYVTLGVGPFDLWLIDPSTDPMQCYEIGAYDAAGHACWSANAMPMRISGEVQKTWLLGGSGDIGPAVEPPGVTSPDALRWFIGGNLDWQELSIDSSEFYWRQAHNVHNAAATDANPMAVSANVPSHVYGPTVMTCDAAGLPTGELVWRIGGDGSTYDNSVTRLMLHEIGSGTSVPAVCNAGRDSAAANLWRNKIHQISGPGAGTAYQTNLLMDKAAIDANGGVFNKATCHWQPAAGHHYDGRCWHPTHGWIEAGGHPAEGVAPEYNLWPDAAHNNTTNRTLLVGTESYCINGGGLYNDDSGNPEEMWPVHTPPASSWVSAITGWTPASGWQGLTPRPTDRASSGLATNFSGAVYSLHNAQPCVYNGSTGHVLWFCSVHFYMAVIEWDGVLGSALTHKTVSQGGVAPLAQYAGGAAWWLEGETYLLQNGITGGGINKGFVLYNNSGAGSWTALTGGAGSPILDASIACYFDPAVAIDRQRRMVYWFVPPPGAPVTQNDVNPPGSTAGPTWSELGISQAMTTFRLYRSSFDDLMNLIPVPVKSRDTLNRYWVQLNHIQAGSQFFQVYDGFIYNMYPKQPGVAIPGNSQPNRATLWRLPIY